MPEKPVFPSTKCSKKSKCHKKEGELSQWHSYTVLTCSSKNPNRTVKIMTICTIFNCLFENYLAHKSYHFPNCESKLLLTFLIVLHEGEKKMPIKRVKCYFKIKLSVRLQKITSSQ